MSAFSSFNLFGPNQNSPMMTLPETAGGGGLWGGFTPMGPTAVNNPSSVVPNFTAGPLAKVLPNSPAQQAMIPNFTPVGATIDAGASNPTAAALQNVGTPQSSAAGSQTVGANSVGQLAARDQIGFNVPTFQLGLAGLQTIGSLWGAFQAQKLAKEQFKYTKNVTEQNLANQIMSYNTALEDKIRGRSAMEAGQEGGMTGAKADEYLSSHKLQRRG